jgi:hypothetical protein
MQKPRGPSGGWKHSPGRGTGHSIDSYSDCRSKHAAICSLLSFGGEDQSCRRFIGSSSETLCSPSPDYTGIIRKLVILGLSGRVPRRSLAELLTDVASSFKSLTFPDEQQRIKRISIEKSFALTENMCTYS